MIRVRSANDRHQHVETLLRNRHKRTQSREFVIQGVRNLNAAVRYGTELHEVWYAADRPLSGWAQNLLDTTSATRVETSAALLAPLSDRAAPGELVAVAGQPDDVEIIKNLTACARPLVVVLDRPSSPGNLGSAIRSCDALGADALLIVGHAADPYDPQAVRASMGSIFAVPVARLGGPAEVLALRDDLRATSPELRLVGAAAGAGVACDRADLDGALMLVLGNEALGLSSALLKGVDLQVHIPMRGEGAPDSLNLAAAASVLLYEAARQRGEVPGGRPIPRSRAGRCRGALATTVRRGETLP